MKILALLHGYPPLQNAGAEWMLHEMLKFCVEKGHDVEVLMPISEMKPYVLEGVKVNFDTWAYTQTAIKDCDIIISHLDRAGRSLNICEFYKKPFVQVIHNSNYYGILAAKHRPHPLRFAYCIYNSEFTKSDCKYPNPSVVVHPPVDPKRYKVKRGKKITLINLFDRKGGLFFGDLAKLMPDYDFLGVEGGYGKQNKVNLPNMQYMDNVADARKFYSETRILLMPSVYESYGRTGIEAMVSGIPVIASPTPGLKESLGDAGIFCQLDSPLKWVDAIKKLDDTKYYNEVSKKCVDRSKEVELMINQELIDMEIFLNDVFMKRV